MDLLLSAPPRSAPLPLPRSGCSWLGVAGILSSPPGPTPSSCTLTGVAGCGSTLVTGTKLTGLPDTPWWVSRAGELKPDKIWA